MAAESKIEWTHATFNPWRGCTKISPGCTHCYAETLSFRNPGVLGIWGPKGTRVVASESYWRQPLKWDREAKEAGERRRVFCASLADVFEDRPELIEPRKRLLRLIHETPNLDWLLLTKRPENVSPMMRMCAPSFPLPVYPPNIWLGVSVEDRARAAERMSILRRIPAAIRFLSVEPLLEDLDLRKFLINGRLPMSIHEAERWGDEVPLPSPIDWVIIGGESGHGARPCDLAWVRSIRDQCRAAGVACFIKQLGGSPYTVSEGEYYRHFRDRDFMKIRDAKGGDWSEWPEDLRIREYPNQSVRTGAPRRVPGAISPHPQK